jgi:hypothetical protein
MKQRIVITSCLALLLSVAAISQTVDALPRSTADRAVEQPLAGKFLAQVQAATDDSTATVKTGWTISDRRGQRRIFDTITLSASAPLAKGGEPTSIFGSDGFPDAFALTGKYTRYSVAVKHRSEQEESALDALCNDVEQKMRTQVEADEQTIRLAKAFGKTDAEATAVAKKYAQSAPFQCDSNTVTKFAKDRRPEFDRLMGVGMGGHRFWGGSASVGHRRFTFLNQDLTESKANNTPWGLSAFVAALPNRMNMLFTLGYDYRNKEKDADKKTLCPASGTPPVECKTGPLGAPVKDNTQAAYLEMRKEFGGRALSLKVAYDFEKDQASLDLPIYLVASGKDDGGLAGGIRVGWVEKQGAQIGVFVTSVFSLFP